MTISFKSKTNTNYMINNKQTSDKENGIQKKSIEFNTSKTIQHKNNSSQFEDSKIKSNEKLSINSVDLEKNSSKNLADFFNGQIVDTEE